MPEDRGEVRGPRAGCATLLVLRGCDEVYDVLLRLGDSLHDQSVNSPERLAGLASKYAECGNVLVALLGGRPVGLCVYYDNDVVGGKAFVSMLVVDKAVQGCGLGAMLLGEALRRCAGPSMRRVSLEVSRDNDGAIRLYERMGFGPVRERGDTLVYERLL